ncbi:MAG: hypothetical protein IPJ69_10930 [Deltaproteobacteria bacterium]|nr:MAG: hypothetical protein IPJ69_10930 [Deltaproteobacteria bacterium]
MKKVSKTLVLAHRGDTQKHLENTLPAFASALKIGVDGIELDLQLTQDGVIVIFHDENLKRLSGRNDKIENLKYSELKKIKLLGGAHIPTLDDLLDLTGNKLLLNLELKSPHYFNGSLEEAVSKKLKNYKYKDQIIFSSFNPLTLIRLKVLCPKIRRGYLFENKFFIHRLILPIPKCYSLHAPLSDLSKNKVEETHTRGKKFFVWTVNHEDDMNRCLEAGVDGIITDQPRLLQKILNKR